LQENEDVIGSLNHSICVHMAKRQTLKFRVGISSFIQALDCENLTAFIYQTSWHCTSWHCIIPRYKHYAVKITGSRPV